MTQNEKRIKIAEWYGITVIPCTCVANPWKDAATGKHLPSYFTDLNAIHEACKKLSHQQKVKFGGFLNYICSVSNSWLVFAEAEQRAEALGRTLKLWE